MHPRGCIFGKIKVLSLYRIRIGVNGDVFTTLTDNIELVTYCLESCGDRFFSVKKHFHVGGSAFALSTGNSWNALPVRNPCVNHP